MTDADDVKELRLRLPVDLHRRIVEQAEAARRSTHAEILYLLESATGQASPALRKVKPRGRAARRGGE